MFTTDSCSHNSVDPNVDGTEVLARGGKLLLVFIVVDLLLFSEELVLHRTGPEPPSGDQDHPADRPHIELQAYLPARCVERKVRSTFLDDFMAI